MLAWVHLSENESSLGVFDKGFETGEHFRGCRDRFMDGAAVRTAKLPP